MTKARSSESVFVCSECATVERKWRGQCSGCAEWNTLIEEAARPAGSKGAAKRGIGPAPAVSRGSDEADLARSIAQPVLLSDVRASRIVRIDSAIPEFDRVLGGGLVPGSLVLLGGSPGIGKSTLVGSALGNLVSAGVPVLYVSGEESPEQIGIRHQRLGKAAMSVPVIAESDIDCVIGTIEAQDPLPRVCVIDSVQTMYCSQLSSAPGSVGQVREVASRLMQLAKSREIAIVLVGHVTKEGSLAGPRVLEHLVDCVLQFEGERERSFRTLRAAKNRFGSTNEVGVFEMADHGLVEIGDPSARFVGEANGDAGSVVLCAIEGTRPLLVQVQALVARSEVMPPRRVVNGIDRNRLALVLAVLGRHARDQVGLPLAEYDVFLNVVGGLRIDEPAADLAIALAVVSAARGEPLVSQSENQNVPLACFGEVGLTGELRPVGQPDRRVAEAVKFGLDRVVLPAQGAASNGVSSVRHALELAFAGHEPDERASTGRENTLRTR